MNCAPILILLVITFIIIISFLYLERNYYKLTKIHETFSDQTIPKHLYKTAPANYLSDLYHSSESNLIGNSNFDNKQDIDGHFGSSYGNEIISFPNPGKGPYVLKQATNTDSPTISYKIATKVKPGQYYKLSSWLHNNLDDKIEEVYKIIVHLRNEKSITYKPEITSVQTATVEGNLWIQNDIIFQIPYESNGKLDISLETDSHTTNGINYMTDLWLEKYHPLLNGVPSHNKLAFFLSSSQEKILAQDNQNQNQNQNEHYESNIHNNANNTLKSNKLWKDVSNNAKDFLFTNNTSYTGNAFNLTNNTIIGPPCSELGVKVNNFTIGWYLSCKPITGKKVFMKLFTSAEKCSTMEISYLSNHPNYCSLTVDFLDKITEWDIGYINNQNIYVLIYNGRNFHLYKDGIPLTAYVKNKSDLTSSEENQSNHCKIGSNNSLCAPNSDLEESFLGNNDTSIEDIYFINKPLLINPNKDMPATINNLFAYDTVLNTNELENINNYFQCAPCSRKNTSSKPQFPIKPVHEHEIIHVKEEGDHVLEEEQYHREKRCDILLEKEDRKQKEKEEKRKISLLCDAHHVRDESPGHGHHVINKLVNDFNEHENINSVNDPCTKIVYHIKSDGKIIRKKMRLANCEECPIRNMDSEVANTLENNINRNLGQI